MKTSFFESLRVRVYNAARDFARMFLDPRFWFWTVLLVAGFAYVAGFICDRPNPLHSRDGAYDQVTRLLFSIPFLFFLGPRHNLEPLNTGRRRFWTRTGAGYLLPFFAALHFAYLQRIPHINYSITWSDLSRMHPAGRIVFSLAAILILALAIYHGRLARKQGILVPYLSSFFGAILALATITWLLRGHYYFHIHHYFLFGFFIPWTRFRNPVSLVCQALCAGVYVEGISEWGMATLWYAVH